MGIQKMIDIKDEAVACQEPCDHTDCEANRRLASTPCWICREAIDAGARMYDIREHGEREFIPAHEQCLIDNFGSISK